MAEEVDARAAPLLGDGQLQKPLLAQPVVIFRRVRGGAVVLGGAGGEIGGERPAAFLQAPVFLGDREIHVPALRCVQPRARA